MSTLKIDKFNYLLLCLFVIYVFGTSFGQIGKFYLLQQIAMSDNFLLTGFFYPKKDAIIPSDVSVYFPGVAIVATFLQQLGLSKIIVELMLFLASITIFLFAIIQFFIWKEILGRQMSFKVFISMGIVYALFICPDWLRYASLLKPDILALTIGLICTFFAYRTSQNSMIFIAILGLTCGVALLFKQQFILYIAGVVLHSLLFPSKKSLLFASMSFLSSAFIIIALYLDNSAWFWTVTILKDDGFLGIKQLFGLNYSTAVAVMFLITSIIFLYNINLISNGDIKHFYLGCKEHLKKSPYLIAIALFVLAAVFSGIKSGGNMGNTQLGLIMFCPACVFFVRRVSLSYLVSIGFILLAGQSLDFSSSLKRYFAAQEMAQFVETKNLPSGKKIISGSDLYFAARKYSSDEIIHAYWTIPMRDNTNIYELSPDFVNFINSDIIFLERKIFDGKRIQQISEFKIVFENIHGYILVRDT